MEGYKYSIGRVVGSKIRNSNTLPTDFTGWLDGDIFIHTDNQLIPYYEYRNKTLNLLGFLKGQSGFTSKIDTGYFSLYVAQDNGTFEDATTGETIDVIKGDIVISTDDSSLVFELDEEGNLYYDTSNALKFIKEE